MSIENAIEAINLTKIYGDHRVLNNLSLNVPRGKITTILGFSGAGKSTLLKHFLGLTRPSSGTLKILGENVKELNDKSLRDFRRNFGMLFQYAALFDSLTSFENVAFPLREFTELENDELVSRVFSLLKSVGLKENSFFKYPHELSGGMRKRVGLARALALRPKIMLYDEPTTGLDPITTKMVNDLIYDTSSIEEGEGLTSVIISHDVKATLKISDYVAFLQEGEIVEFSPVEEFQNCPNPLVRKFLDL
ncbi:MAG: ABC transporter ATP-binding protein [Halobacteriovoraceae bacterium]|nr:ABC transporter ATP-binding protein [Halobacteriovoraceae bacterium]|tara:strand:+ start:1682 stop:2428 length:747 start_codon:yes stop_codon:yes gene_type:complete